MEGDLDILVYIKSGENEELRYAIRSWCENLEFRHLCVVGGPAPRWLKPDIMIDNPTRWSKMRQALNNVLVGISDDRLSENILLMMDDIFIVEKLGRWPDEFNFNRGKLETQIQKSVEKNGKDNYNILLQHTLDELRNVRRIQDPLSYEEHAPFYCNRTKLEQIIDSLGPNAPDILYRTVYGNVVGGYTKYKPDIKIRFPADDVPKNQSIISSNDQSFKNGKIGITLRNWFPHPSKYEA